MECCDGEEMIVQGRGDAGPVRYVLLRCLTCEGHDWYAFPMIEPGGSMPSGGAFNDYMMRRMRVVQSEIVSRAYTASDVL